MSTWTIDFTSINGTELSVPHNVAMTQHDYICTIETYPSTDEQGFNITKTTSLPLKNNDVIVGSITNSDGKKYPMNVTVSIDQHKWSNNDAYVYTILNEWCMQLIFTPCDSLYKLNYVVLAKDSDDD